MRRLGQHPARHLKTKNVAYLETQPKYPRNTNTHKNFIDERYKTIETLHLRTEFKHIIQPDRDLLAKIELTEEKSILHHLAKASPLSSSKTPN